MFKCRCVASLSGLVAADEFTLNKSECSKQAYACMVLHGIMEYDTACDCFSLVLLTSVMIKRDKRGHSYRRARGEIRGPWRDVLQRKHLPRMFSLIKNESQRIEGDQIPP